MVYFYPRRTVACAWDGRICLLCIAKRQAKVTCDKCGAPCLECAERSARLHKSRSKRENVKGLILSGVVVIAFICAAFVAMGW